MCIRKEAGAAGQRKGYPGSFLKMERKFIKTQNYAKNMGEGGAMDRKQIFLLIVNERSYKQGEITREQRDKMLNMIKTKEYENMN